MYSYVILCATSQCIFYMQLFLFFLTICGCECRVSADAADISVVENVVYKLQLLAAFSRWFTQSCDVRCCSLAGIVNSCLFAPWFSFMTLLYRAFLLTCVSNFDRTLPVTTKYAFYMRVFLASIFEFWRLTCFRVLLLHYCQLFSVCNARPKVFFCH